MKSYDLMNTLCSSYGFGGRKISVHMQFLFKLHSSYSSSSTSASLLKQALSLKGVSKHGLLGALPKSSKESGTCFDFGLIGEHALHTLFYFQGNSLVQNVRVLVYMRPGVVWCRLVQVQGTVES